jgi:hypothetical protein
MRQSRLDAQLRCVMQQDRNTGVYDKLLTRFANVRSSQGEIQMQQSGRVEVITVIE